MFDNGAAVSCTSRKGSRLVRFAVLAAAAALFLTLSLSHASAQTDLRQTAQTGPRDFDIPAQPLTEALIQFGRQAGLQTTAEAGLIQGLRSAPVTGALTWQEALDRMLAGTGLSYRLAGSMVTVERPAAQDGDGPIMLGPVTVEAKREFGPNELPPAYAGGQVARGSRLGLLGNRDLFDAPFSVTGYTAELMQNQNARTIADVLENDPSATLAGPSRGGQQEERYAIRGFQAGSARAKLYDGVPNLDFQHTATVNGLERVEIFKGPNAFLNSSISGLVGGAINLVPKRPLDAPLTRATALYEAKGRAGGQVDVSRRFGPENAFGARLNATYFDGEGAIEKNDQELVETSLALDFRKDRFRASVVADYYNNELLGAFEPFFSSVGVPDAPDTKDAIQQPWATNRFDFIRGLLRMEYDIAENWSVHAAGGASHYQNFGFFTYGLGLDETGDFTVVTRRQNFQLKRRSGIAGLHGRFATGSVTHQIAVEGASSKGETGLLRGSTLTIGNSNIFDPVFFPRPDLPSLGDDFPKGSEITANSVAVADTLGFFDERILLTAGLRYQNLGLKSHDQVTGAVTREYDESALTPSVGLVVKPWDSLSLYGNYIEALERGPTAPLTAVNAGEVFPPTVSDQFEVGAKYDGGNFGVTAALFQITKASSLIDANNRFTVDGEQRNRGVEFNVFGEPVPGLRILGGLMYIDAELTKTQDGLLDGERPDGTPPLTAVLNLEWDPQPIPGLTLGFRASHVDSRFVLGDKQTKLPSYQIYSLNARYTREIYDRPVTFRASVNNILDTDYWIARTLVRERTLALGTPRVISLSASMDF